MRLIRVFRRIGRIRHLYRASNILLAVQVKASQRPKPTNFGGGRKNSLPRGKDDVIAASIRESFQMAGLFPNARDRIHSGLTVEYRVRPIADLFPEKGHGLSNKVETCASERGRRAQPPLALLPQTYRGEPRPG